ncbi:hypothetical protein QW694_29540, partial [Methylobacterium isbiliense]|nr:hypothetical protein [Methylobacterium isbiliense]
TAELSSTSFVAVSSWQPDPPNSQMNHSQGGGSIADTMIPEAFEVAHDYSGLITVAGFLAAFVLSKLGG